MILRAASAILALIAFSSQALAIQTEARATSADVRAALGRAGSGPDVLAGIVSQRLSTADAGTWSTQGDLSIWTLPLSMPGASEVAVYADHVSLPLGSTVSISGGSVSFRYGAFDWSNGRLWTQMVPNRSPVLVLSVPTLLKDQAAFSIAAIDVSGSNQVKAKTSLAEADGTLNYDCVRTPTRDFVSRGTININLRKPDRVILASGTLVANSSGGSKPIVLAARHPEVDTDGPTSERLINWNATVTCGQDIQVTARSVAKARSSGATIKALASDIVVYELDQPVPAAADAFFVGVDATVPTQKNELGFPVLTGTDFYGIHHGGNRPQQFVIDEDSSVCSNVVFNIDGDYCTTSDPSKEGCFSWELTSVPTSDGGRTIGGSSGSGLIGPSNRLLGTLFSGGPIQRDDCTKRQDASFANSSYAALYGVWEGPTPEQSIKPWLDTANTGSRIIEGYEAPKPVPSLLLTVAPASITAGDVSTLSWESQNATDCAASGAWSGSKGTRGTTNVAPTAGVYNYTLTCTGPGGSMSSTTRLTVSAAPTPPPPSGGGSGGGGGGGAMGLAALAVLSGFAAIRRKRW